MMIIDDNSISLLSIDSIIQRAAIRWDSKTPNEKIRSSSKYNHIFSKHNLEKTEWTNPFAELSKHQRNILIKGELIRTYDAMTNTEKSEIKKQYKLPCFSSKWFKLDPTSKKILLTSILKDA